MPIFKLIFKSFSSTVLIPITLASSNKSWPLGKNKVGINEVQLTTFPVLIIFLLLFIQEDEN